MSELKKISTIFAAATGILAMTSPAYAVDYPHYPSRLSTSDDAGMGSFLANGDYIGVQDLDYDGRSTVTRWETDYGRSGECKATNGPTNDWIDCNYNFAETGYLRFKVCLRNYSNDIGWINCSDWSRWLSISDGTPRA
ncbi:MULTISPECIES: hypothetical protein [Streptomyces]|uniref:Secreted protein n=2 Tax=Streptomyces violaceusniger group TaxID=2839105 RepID=A0ABD5JPX1_9ACTN|nr:MULTISPECIES: hypothetical protein [Streptomyces]MEE4589164.1 hypothetical protein [Streptomyces sp. DSM 41602]